MDLLAGLNSAQHQAVLHSAGPLVVLAGPGTGKTKLIVHRIAHLIQERSVDPASIVALTYTVKAAAQLRERLTELLAGGGDAQKAGSVPIHTYHAFGQRLIRRFPERLGLGAEPTLIDSAQRIRLLRELIHRDDHLRLMAGQGADAAAAHAVAVMDALSDHGLDAAHASLWASLHAQALAANIAGLDPIELAKQRAEHVLFRQTLALAAAAEKECRSRGWLTFGDLITLPTQLLAHDSDARDILRGTYRHAVVDEFQDVNQATIQLLHRLFPPSPSCDLCVVGDDDQSIYEFRGADDRAFAHFAALWPDHTEIRLSENYRCSDPVIAAANTVITNAASRYAPDKVIRRAAAKPKADPAGACVEAVNIEHKAAGDAIAALILQQREKHPDLPWSKYAVIARGHVDLDRIALTLEAEGIPFTRRRTASAMDDPGVQDLFAWMRTLVSPTDHGAARRILVRPPLALPGPRILELEKKYNALQRAHAEDADAGGQVLGGRVSNPPDSSSSSLPDYLPWVAATEPAVARFAALFTDLRARLPGLPADELIHELALATDAVHADLLPAADRAHRLAAIVSLLRFARNRQSRLPQPGDLPAFLEYFDDLARSDQSSMDDLAKRVEGPESDDDDETGGGVNLLTAHSAKGLEFDTVFIPRVESTHGYPSSRAPDEPAIPPALRWPNEGGPHPDLRARQLAEERRLFYVACTRAERRLVILGKLPKKSSALNFLIELRDPQPPARGLPVHEGADIITRFRPAPTSEVMREALQRITMQDRTAAALELSAAARLDAARALEQAARPDLPAQDLDAITTALRSAAARLSIINHTLKHAEPPSWAADDANALAITAALNATPSFSRAVGDGGRGSARPDEGVLNLLPPRTPLTLSYTSINEYLRCPGCWYLKNVLRLEDAPSTEISLGVIIHEALAAFYSRWQKADADGLPLPTTNDLIAIARAKLKEHSVTDPDALRTVSDQLRTAHEVLHARHPNTQILETPEWSVSFPYPRGPHTHTIRASIDRLESSDGGGTYRIIDYKTGKDWQSLTEPKADNLQMGIYALALDHALGNGSPVAGTAEFWLLATGAVGALDLSTLKRDKVRAQIDKAIDGILAGDFTPNEKCPENSPCRLLIPHATP